MPYTEKTLYQWLKFNYGGPQVDLQRIEAATGAGIPDVNGCAHGREFWLEGKVARYCRLGLQSTVIGPKDPQQDALCFTVRKSQLAWMIRRRRVGGRCWFYVAVPKSLAARLWPREKLLRPARILALGPEAIHDSLRGMTAEAGKITRHEARFGPQEALRWDEWSLVEGLLGNRDKAAA